jgi:transmembrane sensor
VLARHARRTVTKHKPIGDHAAAWLARRDSDEWVPEDEARLTGWLAESTAHRVAFLRLEAVWDETRRLKALSAGSDPGVVPPPGQWRKTPFFESGPRSSAPAVTSSARRSAGNRVRLAVAASVLLAMVVGANLYVRWFASRGGQYSTPVGGMQSVSLQDGSAVTLNTASRIRIALKPEERRIELEQGEAYFVVAKDPTRPFVVAAGDKRIVAVGTQFSVRREGTEVSVVVTEGTVRLESAKSADSLLSAGVVAHSRDGDVLVRNDSVGRAEELLSWREGYLTFHETALVDAVVEFNRYNSRHIAVADPRVASIRISGTFRPTHYEAFVRLLHDGYSIHADEQGSTIMLTQN